MSTGTNLKALRKPFGLSMREMARMVGISHVSWYRYEKEICKPKLETANKICKHFNIDLNYIYPEENNEIL